MGQRAFGFQVVFGYSDYAPSFSFKAGGNLKIAQFVSLYLSYPEFGLHSCGLAAARAAVPEASGDEYDDSLSSEYDVGLTV